MTCRVLLLVILFVSSIFGFLAGVNQLTQKDIEHSTDLTCIESERSLLVVSTLDGKISALKPDTGRLLWTVDSSGPLLSSSLSSIKSTQDLVKLRFIPSLDGVLFHLNNDKIEPLPFSVEALVGKIQRLPDGSHIIGGKEVSLSGIDMLTGVLQYTCTTTGCYPLPKETSHIGRRDILLARRVQHTVRAVDERTGSERWNFSVGTIELELPETLHNHYRTSEGCKSEEMNKSEYHKFTFNIGEGFISSLASDASSKQWEFHFRSPLTAVWRIHNDLIEPLDLFRHSLFSGIEDQKVHEHPVRYMGIHEGQIYIQHPYKLITSSSEKLDQEAYFANIGRGLVVAQPYLGGWRPYVSSSPSRTPSLMNDKRLSVWNNMDYPFDNGYYVVAYNKEATSTDLMKTHKGHQREKKDVHSESNHTERNEPESLVASTILDWWKEILLLAFLISVLMQISFKMIRKRVKRCQEEKVPVEEAVAMEESVSPVRRSYPSMSYSTDGGEYELAPSYADFVSRYLTDFEHKQCLGKGGFGVVFKARNKLDDCEYAVKRIQIPSCKEAREKVMREVRALAKLDHPGIVRYFHAWWESPPKGWQAEKDAEFFEKRTADDALSRDWCLQVDSSVSSTTSRTVSKSRDGNTVTTLEELSDEAVAGDGERSFEKRSVINSIARRTEEWTERLIGSDGFELNLNKDADTGSFQVEFAEGSSASGIEVLFNNSADGEGCCLIEVNSDKSVASVSPCESLVGRKAKVLSTKEEINHKNSKAKYVGRCCGKSFDCITAPPSFLYIQMQLCMQESLKEWLRQGIVEREKSRCLKIFHEIVKAVSYFHSQGMMHRDLKPSNIFFALDGKVKVGDFGLVTAITRPADGQGNMENFAHENHTGQVGTQLYMSPEQIMGKAYDHKVDIYSLGVILLELLQIFETEMERASVLYKLKVGILPKDFVDKHTREADLVESLISEDPGKRLEADEIIERLENDEKCHTSVTVEERSEHSAV